VRTTRPDKEIKATGGLRGPVGGATLRLGDRVQHCLRTSDRRISSVAERLGGRLKPTTTLIAIATTLVACCATVRVDDSHRRASRRSDHYVVVDAESEIVFRKVRCLGTLEARDTDSSADMHRYILHTLRSDGRLRRCESPQAYQLLASYEAGNGVCIDCDVIRSNGRSAFATLTVVDANGRDLASAEWQDWQGGSEHQVADRFIADLRRLMNGEIKSASPDLREH